MNCFTTCGGDLRPAGGGVVTPASSHTPTGPPAVLPAGGFLYDSRSGAQPHSDAELSALLDRVTLRAAEGGQAAPLSCDDAVRIIVALRDARAGLPGKQFRPENVMDVLHVPGRVLELVHQSQIDGGKKARVLYARVSCAVHPAYHLIGVIGKNELMEVRVVPNGSGPR